MWNPFSKGNSDEQRPQPPAPIQPIIHTKPFGERMQRELDKTRWAARKAGDRLPVAALPQLGRIEDVLVPLLEHLVTHPPSVDEEIAVQGMVTDYLPTTVNTYVGLNPQFAEMARPDGRTPGDDLMEQLVTLETAAHDLSRSVYAHDAQALETQGRFLSAKFTQSDLTI